MFLMGIFWYHLYDMSNYKLCNLDTYNHNFGSSVGIVRIICFRGSGKPLLQDKTTPHAKPVYITE